MPGLIKKHWLAAAVIVAVIILGGYFAFGRKKTMVTDFTAAKRGDLTQIVSVTGNIKPAQSVNLAFEKSGRAQSVYVDVGDKVYAGELLVQLDDSELSAQLDKAEADLASQESALNKAQVVLDNYYNDVSDVLNDAYTKANDAVRNQTLALFTNPETNPKLIFSTYDSQNELNLESRRLAVSGILNSWLGGLNRLQRTSPPDALEAALSQAETNLAEVRKFLDLADRALTDSVFLSQSAANTYKTGITSGRAEVNAAISGVVGKEQDINTQKTSVASAGASVKSYEANIEDIRAQIGKMKLYSPIGGVVTAEDAKAGEIVAANSEIVSVISASQFDIEAYVPEADIAKIKIGDSATLTLDAYGSGAIFDATVVKIDPGETVIEGVPTYKTTLRFAKEDERIKSGMTANIDVLTAKRENAVYVPHRSVVTKNSGETYVLLETSAGGKTEEHGVETGIRGSDGNIEIVSGLNEGDKVATFGE